MWRCAFFALAFAHCAFCVAITSTELAEYVQSANSTDVVIRAKRQYCGGCSTCTSHRCVNPGPCGCQPCSNPEPRPCVNCGLARGMNRCCACCMPRCRPACVQRGCYSCSYARYDYDYGGYGGYGGNGWG